MVDDRQLKKEPAGPRLFCDIRLGGFYRRICSTAKGQVRFPFLYYHSLALKTWPTFEGVIR